MRDARRVPPVQEGGAAASEGGSRPDSRADGRAGDEADGIMVVDDLVGRPRASGGCTEYTRV